MAEFDFDELDKAVTSLMKKQADVSSEPNPNSASSDSSPSEIRSSVGPAMQPTDDSSDVAATDASAVSHQPEPASREDLPRRVKRTDAPVQRRGKFMDVMHSPTVTAPVAKKPARYGNTIQPTANGASEGGSISPLPPRAVDGISQPPNLANVSSSEQTIGPQSSINSNEPDRLETTETLEAGQADQPNIETLDTGFELSDDKSIDESIFDPVDVMKSPFLPDAKVEKRPLGTQATIQLADLVDSSEDTELADYGMPVETGSDSTSSTGQTELPDELSRDVLSLELDTTSQVAPETTADLPVAVETAVETPPVDNSEVSDEQATPTVGSDDSASITPSTALIGALPPRQVSVSEADDEADDAPQKSIFDSDEPQPIKSQPKRSSAWYTIVIIGAMLLIGVIGGVIVYLLNNGY